MVQSPNRPTTTQRDLQIALILEKLHILNEWHASVDTWREEVNQKLATIEANSKWTSWLVKAIAGGVLVEILLKIIKS